MENPGLEGFIDGYTTRQLAEELLRRAGLNPGGYCIDLDEVVTLAEGKFTPTRWPNGTPRLRRPGEAKSFG